MTGHWTAPSPPIQTVWDSELAEAWAQRSLPKGAVGHVCHTDTSQSLRDQGGSAGFARDGLRKVTLVQSGSGSGRGTAGTGKAMRHPLQGWQGCSGFG